MARAARGVLDHLKVHVARSPDDRRRRCEPRTATSCSSACAARSGGATCRCSCSRRRRPDEATAQAAELRRDGFREQAVPRARAAGARAHAAARAPRDAARALARSAPRRWSSRRCAREAEKRRQLVDILHEVHGDFSAEELYHILVRRVAHALDISHCSLILARPGDEVGVVVRGVRDAGAAPPRDPAQPLSRDPRGARDVRAGARGGRGDEPAVRRGARGMGDRAQRCEGAVGDRAPVPHRWLRGGRRVPAHARGRDAAHGGRCRVRGRRGEGGGERDPARAGDGDHARGQRAAGGAGAHRCAHANAQPARADGPARIRAGSRAPLFAHALAAHGRPRSLQGRERHLRPPRRRRGAARRRAACCSARRARWTSSRATAARSSS